MKHTGLIVTITIIFTLLTGILIGVIFIHRIGNDKQIGPTLSQILDEMHKKNAKIKAIRYDNGLFGSQFVAMQDGGGFLVSNLPFVNGSGYFITYYNAEFQPVSVYALNDSKVHLIDSDKEFSTVKDLLGSKKRGMETFVKRLIDSGEILKATVPSK